MDTFINIYEVLMSTSDITKFFDILSVLNNKYNLQIWQIGKYLGYGVTNMWVYFQYVDYIEKILNRHL